MPDTPIVFDDVEVLSATDMSIRCRVRKKTVMVGSLQPLAGTTISHAGDRGRLVLPRWVAEDLGLIER
jgi:hypothetical protein